MGSGADALSGRGHSQARPSRSQHMVMLSLSASSSARSPRSCADGMCRVRGCGWKTSALEIPCCRGSLRLSLESAFRYPLCPLSFTLPAMSSIFECPKGEDGLRIGQGSCFDRDWERVTDREAELARGSALSNASAGARSNGWVTPCERKRVCRCCFEDSRGSGGCGL